MSRSSTEELLTALLETGVGYGIELFGVLNLYQLEDGRFAVNIYRYDAEARVLRHEEERIFTCARDAVRCFESERADRELGFDFEVDPDNVTDGHNH